MPWRQDSQWMSPDVAGLLKWIDEPCSGWKDVRMTGVNETFARRSVRVRSGMTYPHALGISHQRDK